MINNLFNFIIISFIILCLSLKTAFAQLDNEKIITPNDAPTSRLTASPIHAVKDHYLPSEITEDSYEKLSTDKQKEMSAIWNLSITEYQHYLWLMEHTQNGEYYRHLHLDPNWVLGINAANEQERQKYAMIALKNERERINKELAFQREFSRLAQQLFPNEKPIQLQN